MLPNNVIDRAFASDTKLKKRIFDAISATPRYGPLFEDIAKYHLNAKDDINDTSTIEVAPAAKKRKLNGVLPIAEPVQDQPRQVVLEARDISFTLPQRKKYHLGIAQYGTDLHAKSTTFSLFICAPATNAVELEIPLSRYAYALRLPVPEKTTKQYNFCLIPNPSSQPAAEPMIWTILHGPVKSLNIPSTALSAVAKDSEDIFETVLGFILSRSGTTLTYPDADEFASATPESHRRNEKAYHVKAFRGSKDGFLFFLHHGIFFGFKKPLIFFPFDDIESVSYTSVLQRTFNLNIAYRTTANESSGEPGEVQEIEFSMLDQADFPGIDAYIKRHELQDASLADSRRAKKANVNGSAKAAQGVEGQGGEEDDGRTELERAQQQLEDEEDEEEEDYDPSSDDESEGSEDDSSDGDDEDQDEEESTTVRKRSKVKTKDLVADELGSEAEDVSITEDEENAKDGGPEGEDGEDVEMAIKDEQNEESWDEEEEEEEEEEEVQDIKPATAGFASVARTGVVQRGRWGHQLSMPDPNDDDQL